MGGPVATLVSYVAAMAFGTFMVARAWRELPKAGWWGIGLVLSAGWANLGYVIGMLHGEVMRVLLLFYLAPLWAVIFSHWLLGERLKLDGYVVMALSLAGAVTMLWRRQNNFPVPQNLSEWVGLSAGISFALSSVVSRRTASLSIEAKAYSALLGTTILTTPFLWAQRNQVVRLWTIDPQSASVLVLLGLSLFASSYAVQYGVTNMVSNRAMLLFLFELVIAAVSSYFLAGEALQPHEWAGAVLIVLASILSGRTVVTRNRPD